MAAASAAVATEKTTIHAITEVDISKPRFFMEGHQQRTGEKLSLTAYIITCLSHAITETPELNSFRKGRKLIVLEDVTVNVLIERNLNGEKIPEPIGIQAAQLKTYRQIHDEIRDAQRRNDNRLGSLTGSEWIRFIPSFLFKVFIRAASHNIHMMKRYGVVSVTAVGMFASGALWFVPLGGATVLVTVGSIVKRPVFKDGQIEEKEFLCLTISFDHEIVDGAPAARFVKQFSSLISSGDFLKE
jgi:pyruvate/2-oxoglutarate dehydrogenase complex dihydrolipoamide acyltransferase (E2) component